MEFPIHIILSAPAKPSQISSSTFTTYFKSIVKDYPQGSKKEPIEHKAVDKTLEV